MENLTADGIHPPNPPAHRGAPYDSSGSCIHHPSVKLASLSRDDDDAWVVERKRCPKCCLNSIIHETVRKSEWTGRSFRSVGRYGHTTAGGSSASVVSCASLPYSFEGAFRNDNHADTKLFRGDDDQSRRSEGGSPRGATGRDSESTDGGRGENRGREKHRDRRRDPPRDDDDDVLLPLREPMDPSAVSSISSRRSVDRSFPPMPSSPDGRTRRIRRDRSPESTMGLSTIPTAADASTCSTITMDTALFDGRPMRRNYNRRRHRNGNDTKKKRPYSSDLIPVRENDDSRGRDPEHDEDASESPVSGVDRSYAYYGGHPPRVPSQVHVPKGGGEEDRIVLISNMPKDIGQDQDVVSVAKSHQSSSQDGSRNERGDDPSTRDGGEANGRPSKYTSELPKSRRRSRSLDEHRISPRNRSSARHSPRNDQSNPCRHRGDASYFSQPSLATSSSRCHSVRSHSSRHSIRHDIDPNGYCSHHPDIRLMKPDERDNNYWTLVRKKCPKCIREDCPSVFGEERKQRRSVRSTPFHNNDDDDDQEQEGGSVRSIESSVGSSFFLSSLQTPEEIEEEEDTRRLKRRLAARAYHFPGNTWCEDWFQYISNTHTVLGLFFHHPLHPLKVQERLVILFGSIAIGLTISNLFYMHFLKKGGQVDEELFMINLSWLGMSEVTITKLMVTLWTLGSFLHTLFDLGLWHMKACTLCRYGGQIDDRIARWGRVMGLFIVVSVMAAGSYAVLLRASIEYKGDDGEGSSVEEAIRNNEFYVIDFEGKKSFRFLLGYLVEFLLAMFLYYPIAVTVIFSGLLGCGGRIPILGGRPREIKREMKYEMSKKSPRILKTLKLGANETGTDDENTSDVYSTSYRDEMAENRII